MSNKRLLRISSLSLLCAIGSIASALAAGWDSVPLGGGGLVTGVVSNTDGSAIYCRTDVGGAFRWVPAVDGTNGSWVSITDAMVPYGTSGASGLMNVEGLATDPSYLNRVYIGAGNGIWGSDDKGTTWYQIRSGLTMAGNGTGKWYGERLAVDPNNSNIVWYASIGSGLQKGVLTSGSWAWSQIPTTSVPLGAANIGVTFVVCDKNGTNTITYAGVSGSSGGGVYRSLDSGSTWNIVPGAAFTGPRHAQIASNGTVYITGGAAGVAKILRSGTLSLLPALAAGPSYGGIAVDPNDATGNIVYVADSSSVKIWRTANGGTSCTLQSSYTGPRVEPDGTSCRTGYWFGATSSLLVNPANSRQLMAGDFFGVSATYNADVLGSGTGSTWYTLQKGQEETVVDVVKNGPGGPRLMTGVSDVGGFGYDDITVRPYGAGGNSFSNPYGGNNTSLDFCESDPNIWVRAYVQQGANWSPGTGAYSYDGGMRWAAFGQLDQVHIALGSSNQWIEWNVVSYLKQHLGGTVTLILRDDNYQHGGASYSSKEGANPPQLLLNGTATLTPTADTYVRDGSYAAINSGTESGLSTKTYDGGYTRWTYLKFDLTGVTSLNSAKLRLYLLATDSADLYVSAYAHDNTSWIESGTSGITWNTRPLFKGIASTYCSVPPVLLTNGANGGGGGRIVISATDAGNIVWLPINYTQNTIPAYYSRDGGVTWAASTGGPNSQITGVYTNGNSLGTSGQCLASDRGNGNFYLGAFGGSAHSIYRSTDKGATWTKISTVSNGNSYNMRTPQLVAAPVSPACPNGGDLWLCDDGTYHTPPDTGYGLWRSTNSGTSWQTVTTLNRVSAISFGQSSTGVGYSVYVAGYKGTTYGIYRSDDYGATSDGWTLLANPTIEGIISVAGDRQMYNSLFIGTAGRGTFHYNAGPTTISVSDSADAYVRDGSYADVNYGTDVSLFVKNDGTSYARWTYLTFDLSRCSSTITSGTLKLCVSSTSGASATPIAVYPCSTTNWIESGTGSITWNNKPAATGSALATVTVPASTLPGTWVSWNVGSYLQQQKSAGINTVTLILEGTVLGSNNWVNFNSDEAGSNTPQLSVTYQ